VASPNEPRQTPTPVIVQVSITRKAGLSDPEGVETNRALRALGYEAVDAVHFGRILTLDLDAQDEAAATAAVAEMCERLLANPVIEDYTIEVIG